MVEQNEKEVDNILQEGKMAHSCEDLSGKEDAKNPFLFSNFVKKGKKVDKGAKVWNNFDSSNESIDHAPFPDLVGVEEGMFSGPALLFSSLPRILCIKGEVGFNKICS